MIPRPTVFIQSNRQQLLAAKVSEYSMKKASSHASEFDVNILCLESYPALYEREGEAYLREGRKPQWFNSDLQSFTPLRFLPPQLMGYQGKALVIDPDVFAVGDVFDFFERDMKGKAILCRRIDRPDGSHYYASSVMLLHCERLTHWRWEEQIAELFAFKRDYRQWISLLLEPEDHIGLLEEEWNHFDTLNETTKLLHNTRRITQPWKTGLPIDFEVRRHRGVVGAFKQMRAFLKGEIGRTYWPHPDPCQGEFFFSLLKECVEEGVLTEEWIEAEIAEGHIRPDTFSLLRTDRNHR